MLVYSQFDNRTGYSDGIPSSSVAEFPRCAPPSTACKPARHFYVFIVVSAFALPPAHSNEDHQLNHVWSRIADLRGEFGSVESAEFSPDSQYIATGTKYDNTVRVFRTVDGVMQWQLQLPAEIERVAWDKQGGQLVSVSEDHWMRVIDARSGKIVKEIKHGNGMDSLALSSDGKIMAVGEEMRGESTGDRSTKSTPVILYDTSNWEEIRRFDQRATANEISFSSDDRYFAVVGGDALRIWETDTGREIAFHQPFYDSENPASSRFICAKFSPDNRFLAVGANHGWLYFYDAQSGEYIRRLNKTGDKIETVEWTKDSKYLLSAGKGNVIDFIAASYATDKSLDNGAVPIAMRIPMTDQLEYMHFNATGALLTTAHQDGTVQLWTYQSDNPGINQRLHHELTRQQAETYGD